MCLPCARALLSEGRACPRAGTGAIRVPSGQTPRGSPGLPPSSLVSPRRLLSADSGEQPPRGAAESRAQVLDCPRGQIRAPWLLRGRWRGRSLQGVTPSLWGRTGGAPVLGGRCHGGPPLNGHPGEGRSLWVGPGQGEGTGDPRGLCSGSGLPVPGREGGFQPRVPLDYWGRLCFLLAEGQVCSESHRELGGHDWVRGQSPVGETGPPRRLSSTKCGVPAPCDASRPPGPRGTGWPGHTPARQAGRLAV